MSWGYVAQRGPKQAINEKIRVLRDFYVVDDRNEDAVRARFEKAVKECGTDDYDRVLDSIARSMISIKLGGV